MKKAVLSGCLPVSVKSFDHRKHGMSQNKQYYPPVDIDEHAAQKVYTVSEDPDQPQNAENDDRRP